MLTRFCKLVVIACTLGLTLLGFWSSSARVQDPVTQTHKPARQSFEQLVVPVLTETCSGCHDDRTASGGLNLGLFTDASTLVSRRDEWDTIVRRIEAGEMPPNGSPKDAAPLTAMLSFLKQEFARADRLLKPDPGRIVARRLNRVEYQNTIRDLLGVNFRADREFPRDDEGEGFDNIADLLSVSPLLAEKYLTVAATIAAKAMGTETLPKPTEFGYMANLDPKIRKHAEALIYYGQEAWLLDASTLEFKHHVDYDGEYNIHIDMAGARGKDGKPVTLNFWMDDKLLESRPLETATPKIGGFGMYPYWGFETKLVLPQGDHVFRLGITGDTVVKTLSDADAYNPRKNIYPYGVKFFGPFPAKVESASRKKILLCDPKTGLACSQKIVRSLARRAFRRPVTGAEVVVVNAVRQNGRNAGAGHSKCDSRHAGFTPFFIPNGARS